MGELSVHKGSRVDESILFPFMRNNKTLGS